VAHQISGLEAEIALDYFEKISKLLTSFGYEVLNPMATKAELHKEGVLTSLGYELPSATNHAIFKRDTWMCKTADILYINLENVNRISIGCIMELAIGAILNKHTIVVSNTEIYNHAFIIESADIIFDNSKDAEEYLRKLIKGEI
jgi:nucleoside 2-deoxyribosyltransferase